MVRIPYRGSAPAFTDLIAGQVQFMAESIPQAAQYHKQGKVRALAVTSRERNPALPEVRNRMITQGADPAFLGADDFAKFLTLEMPKWAAAVQKSGAKLD
jgi:tripartite-type tricarboxylate transporter receptor subunit TctC